MRSIIIMCVLLTYWSYTGQMHSYISRADNAIPHLKKVAVLGFTNGFDFPVGKPDANKYYNAQAFGKNDHLGDDWNGIGGGNTDLGDPIYSIANGYVSFAENIGGGWGNIIIKHFLKNGESYESLYAHCDSVLVKKGDYILKGTKIGTIGTANGQYLAHLHFEIRNILDLPVGNGYAKDKTGYIDPNVFILSNRK